MRFLRSLRSQYREEGSLVRCMTVPFAGGGAMSAAAWAMTVYARVRLVAVPLWVVSLLLGFLCIRTLLSSGK